MADLFNFVCCRCRKSFWDEHPGYSIIYDKCRGKACLECGKIRVLGKIKTLQWKNTNFGCVKCGEPSSAILNGICKKCFLERERKKGCVCAIEEGIYYCSLCEEIHDGNYAICKKCFKEQDSREVNERNSFQIILLTSIISLIVGFFLAWLFLVKLRKKKRTKP